MARTPLIACLLALLAAPVSVSALAQEPDSSCPTGLAEAYLDINNVRARLLNDGMLFWRGSPYGYEVPNGSGRNGILSAAIWVTGLIDDSLRAAATTYRPAEYWPGPLADDGSAGGDCSKFDRIWSMDRDIIEEYERTGRVRPDLAGWPTGLGAPTLDAAGNRIDLMMWPLSQRLDRVIDLEKGERPLLSGDQMHWWIMNDAGGEHRTTGSPPIGVEIQMTAFAFGGSGVIRNTTFYRLLLRKPAGPPLEEAHFGLYADTDLGYPADDYVGSDSLLGLAYTYNADNFDQGEIGYGMAPPALGIDFLRGPLVDADGIDNDGDQRTDEPGERLAMTTAKNRDESPIDAQALHNHLQGLWWDGRSMTEGGGGLNFSEIPTKWMFSGSPPAYWSELNSDGIGSGVAPAHRTVLSGMGPFVLSSDQPQEILIGIITSFGADNLDSIRQLKEDDVFIQNLVDDGLLDLPAPSEPVPQQYDLAASFYPIPAAGSLTMRYSLPSEMAVRIDVFDLLGRLRAGLVDATEPPGWHSEAIDVSTWRPGVYLARLQMDHRTFTRKLVVVR
ncbi:MAG: hypothetical protein ACI84D_002311 [Thalassolituus oleivorans]